MKKNALELFAGSHSFTKVARKFNYNCISVDISDKLGSPTYLTDIMEWDYKQYPRGYFHVIWASPPCNTFSVMNCCNIGRYHKRVNRVVKDMEDIIKIQEEYGLPLLRKAQEIIEYFNPEFWFIENPKTSRMKNYIADYNFVFSYCKYGFDYQKDTRIWTNCKSFKPLPRCKFDCDKIIEGTKKHISRVAYLAPKERYKMPPNFFHAIFKHIEKIK